jgi:hypothetical protein
MELIKPITSDHDLIKLADILNVHLDAIYEFSEIKRPLPKKGTFIILLRKPNMDVGHWTCAHNGSYFDSMGEGPQTSFGSMKYNEFQYQGAHDDYCGIFCILWLYCMQHKKQHLLKRFNNLNIVVL